MDEDVRRKQAELINAVGDADVLKKAYQRAYELTGEHMDAQDDSQEAIKRFILMVRSKTKLVELEEIERKGPLPYIYKLLPWVKAERWRRVYGPTPQGRTKRQADDDAPEISGRQKCELLATRLGMTMEDIADHQQTEGRVGAAGLGMEEQADSEMWVDTFINSLPEKLRTLATLLAKEEYKLNEIARELNLSYRKLINGIRRIRKALRDYMQKKPLRSPPTQ